MKSLLILFGLVSLIHFKSAGALPLLGKLTCINVWDDGCSNGQLPDAGRDDDYFNGGFNPGKRCIGPNCNGNIDDLAGYGSQFDRQYIYRLLAKIYKNQH